MDLGDILNASQEAKRKRDEELATDAAERGTLFEEYVRLYKQAIIAALTGIGGIGSVEWESARAMSLPNEVNAPFRATTSPAGQPVVVELQAILKLKTGSRSNDPVTHQGESTDLQIAVYRPGSPGTRATASYHFDYKNHPGTQVVMSERFRKLLADAVAQLPYK